jgi:transposase
MAVDWETKRQDVVYLLKSGEKPEAIACKLGCSPRWVYKCQARYQQEGWDGLKSHSRAPHRHPTALEPEVKEAIRTARRELELEAQEPERLSYIGARAVQGRLHEKGVQPLPSASSIEREIRRAGLSRPRRSGQPEVTYPQLQPTQAHQLIQVDIYPRLLPGGQSVACFNALDVVSRYPTGWQSLTKTAQDAAEFLVQVWQEVGLSHYTQVDNESCFSGGFTHPYVLGRVVRLALAVGTELVFPLSTIPKAMARSSGFIRTMTLTPGLRPTSPRWTCSATFLSGFSRIIAAAAIIRPCKDVHRPNFI